MTDSGPWTNPVRDAQPKSSAERYDQPSASMKATVNDPGIVCVQHCRSKIFTIDPLTKCPECEADLNENGNVYRVPFRLPYPFVVPHQHPCSIVLRPTHGDFLNDYLNAMNLHIAITTSTGTIVEFDRAGWMETCKDTGGRESAVWSQSLVVDSVPAAWHDQWDTVLRDMKTMAAIEWRPDMYHADRYNCYTFVLEFLQRLRYGALSEAAQNRSTFCEQYIIPRTTAAGKYISLYRKIRDHGFYVNALNATRNN